MLLRYGILVLHLLRLHQSFYEEMLQFEQISEALTLQ